VSGQRRGDIHARVAGIQIALINFHLIARRVEQSLICFLTLFRCSQENAGHFRSDVRCSTFIFFSSEHLGRALCILRVTRSRGQLHVFRLTGRLTIGAIRDRLKKKLSKHYTPGPFISLPANPRILSTVCFYTQPQL